LKNRDFRKELEDREREVKDKTGPRRLAIESRDSSSSSTKRPKVDQVPAASLDADDPLDEDDSESESEDDDTEALMAELQRIRKERAAEQAKKVSLYFLK
jgi:protein CWC15